jgi:uncharacterized protein involved in tolerance to divalent cations
MPIVACSFAILTLYIYYLWENNLYTEDELKDISAHSIVTFAARTSEICQGVKKVISYACCDMWCHRIQHFNVDITNSNPVTCYHDA